MPEKTEQPDERNPSIAKTGSLPSDFVRDGQAVSCRRIQAVLFDYLTREMGDARAMFVREHLIRCEHCRGAAARLERARDRLRAFDPGSQAPERLSANRKRRLDRALRHPFFEAICRHHTLVSLLAALLLIGAVIAWLLVRRESEPPEGIPVRLIMPEWYPPFPSYPERIPWNDHGSE